ncbi:AAA family ATPase [Pseudomonas fontis]|uniref:AAA family ATPase n=1 Tax=Pseudomonas fontis TaxID=2942633 RepID=A0ABT5NUM8_9PSED|nr:AAA family ATPase [Pseudomonas fontis]MDD0974266.1 AAA family ATPase [Pseudomonas fontis]MDD0991883.1 AAA family ATPase [Pseudomonas fontis]
MQVNQDDIVALIEAALDANYSDVRAASNRIAKSISSDDLECAKKIKSILRKKGVPLQSSGYIDSLPVDSKSRAPLLEETQWPVTPLVLNQESQNVFQTFLSDVINVDELISHGLSGRLNFLLSGPPGTGKSLVAGHIAAQLNRPLYTVRLDSVISSLLGDTAKNIRQIFDFIPKRNGVLFLDEVDAVAKLRDDRHELGELKRVVNTLIQGLDSLDDHAVVIAATNHSGLLDPAIWRRFPYKIDFSVPDLEMRKELWKHFLFVDGGEESMILMLAKISDGLSGGDIESLSLAVRRKSVLTKSDVNMASVVEATMNSALGNTATPEGGELSTFKKKKIATILYKSYGVAQVDLAKILSTSRQTISGYLRE